MRTQKNATYVVASLILSSLIQSPARADDLLNPFAWRTNGTGDYPSIAVNLADSELVVLGRAFSNKKTKSEANAEAQFIQAISQLITDTHRSADQYNGVIRGKLTNQVNKDLMSKTKAFVAERIKLLRSINGRKTKNSPGFIDLMMLDLGRPKNLAQLDNAFRNFFASNKKGSLLLIQAENAAKEDAPEDPLFRAALNSITRPALAKPIIKAPSTETNNNAQLAQPDSNAPPADPIEVSQTGTGEF